MSEMPSSYAALISEICKEEHITLTPLSECWAFHLQKGNRNFFLYGYQFPLNSASSSSVCTDKSTASELLTLHSIPCVPHTCFMNPEPMKYASPRGNHLAIRSLLEQYQEIVLKDNSGTGGDLVFRAKTLLQAENAAQKIFSRASSMAVCPYERIQDEYRVILLKQSVKLLYRKVRPVLTGDGISCVKDLYARYLMDTAAKDIRTPHFSAKELTYIPASGELFPLQWKHNLGKGARAQVILPVGAPTAWDPSALESAFYEPLAALAKAAAQALDIHFASIDIIQTKHGFQILEVNSGVMMEYLSMENESHKKIAKEIYRDAILASLA